LILVTVGMHHQGFERLIEAMDAVAATTDEQTVMQIGTSAYEPRYASWFRFGEQERLEQLCAQARAIVGHAGAGTVIAAVRHNRPLVLVPRRFARHEHVDDHQIELARILATAGTAVMVEPPRRDSLIDAIEAATALEHAPRCSESLVDAVATALAAPPRTRLGPRCGSA
jgi:UDP-N-acetylglucosamine transferase subunit ALG13